MYWRGSCSLCSINTAILCTTAIPRDHYSDDGTHTHALSVSLLLSYASICHGSFDLNTDSKIPVFGVDSIIPPGLDSARYLNVTSSFRHRHPLSTQLSSEPTAHVNSHRGWTCFVFRCGGWRGSSWVFQWRRGYEGSSEHHIQGHSTSQQWPTRHFPKLAYKVARGAVQSLETTFHPSSFEAHKPISSDTTLSRKNSNKKKALLFQQGSLPSSPLRSSPGK